MWRNEDNLMVQIQAYSKINKELNEHHKTVKYQTTN